MDDLISRAMAIDAVYYKPNYKMAIEVLKEVPAVDAMPVVHGHWKDNGNGTVSCNCCATWFPKTRESQLQFCGYCGAKMDE